MSGWCQIDDRETTMAKPDATVRAQVPPVIVGPAMRNAARHRVEQLRIETAEKPGYATHSSARLREFRPNTSICCSDNSFCMIARLNQLGRQTTGSSSWPAEEPARSYYRHRPAAQREPVCATITRGQKLLPLRPLLATTASQPHLHEFRSHQQYGDAILGGFVALGVALSTRPPGFPG